MCLSSFCEVIVYTSCGPELGLTNKLRMIASFALGSSMNAMHHVKLTSLDEEKLFMSISV